MSQSKTKLISKVSHAVIQSLTLHHPKIGNLGTTLSSTKGAAMKEMALSIVDLEGTHYLNVTVKGIDIQIPMPNVAYFTLES